MVNVKGSAIELECFHTCFLQVNMDLDPVEMAISPDIFAELKQSNPARWVKRHVFFFLLKAEVCFADTLDAW